MKKSLISQILSIPLFIFGLSLGGTNQAFAALGDYDGDGTSDVAVGYVNRANGSTTWIAKLTGKTIPKTYVFQRPGDALVQGRYYPNDERSYPGIVFVQSATLPLEWRIKNAQGTEHQFYYGFPGDTVTNQGDLDCDGITDIAIVRDEFSPSAGEIRKFWWVALSGSGGTIIKTRFGRPGDRVYTANINGSGCRDLVLLRAQDNGFFMWMSRKLTGTKVKHVVWGMTGDIPLVPQDMNGDSKADYIVSRAGASGQTLWVRNSGSTYSNLNFGGKDAVPMIGKFSGQHKPNRFAAWNRTSGALATRISAQFVQSSTFGLPFGSVNAAFVRPDGTVIQPQDTLGFGGTNTGGIRCDKEINRNDGPGGFTNNPHSSRNTLKVMFSNAYTGKISAVKVASNNQVTETLYQATPNEWGNRERYYGRESIGSYPDNLLVIVELFGGAQHCVTLPDPQRRYD